MGNRKPSRLGDRSHPSLDPLVTASANVLIHGRRAARVGDRTRNNILAVEGTPTVLVNNRPLHRLLDRHSGSCSADGAPRVLVGDVGWKDLTDTAWCILELLDADGKAIPHARFLLSDGTSAKLRGQLDANGRALVAFADCKAWPLKFIIFEAFCGVHEVLDMYTSPPAKLPQGVVLTPGSTTGSPVRHDLSHRALFQSMHHTFYVRFDVQRIPEIMDTKQFVRGAKFLRKWFAASSQGSGFAGRFDNTTIDMTWVMSFSEVSSALERHLQHQKYLSEAGKKAIGDMITATGLSSGELNLVQQTQKAINRGDDAESRRLMVNYLSSADFLGTFRDLDDLSAALNRFTLRFTCDFSWQKVWTATGAIKDQVTISRVGAYVRDSFDFDDGVLPQPLGYWSDEKKDVARFAVSSKYHGVWNSTFRTWRECKGRGGDFLVLSKDIVVYQVAHEFIW